MIASLPLGKNSQIVILKEARAQVAAEIETYALVAAQLLRQQLSYPPGADSQERDAYCQANLKQKK